MSILPHIALLGPIPLDVQEALKGSVMLLDAQALSSLPADLRSTIAKGVTSAFGGADPHMLDFLPGLRLVASVGAGTEAFDLADLAARAIAFHPTPDVMTEDTAECAVALVFALLRNSISNDKFVRNGEWAKARAPLGWRISQRKIGVVGLGRIGRRVAEKLEALSCSISYSGRSRKDVSWTFVADVGALAKQVDVLVLTCSGGQQTRGLINADILRQLGSQGFLVNVSRGSVVDESSLISALEQRQIAGAALDVFENEPTPDPRFLDLPNCILSPHSAVLTRENRRDLIAEIKRLLGLQVGLQVV
ncbi:MAG: NAD(P)-dependent oxidoreductase [Hyphomicrobiales bacterium]